MEISAGSPLPIAEVADIGKGAYTQIITIIAPSSAVAGETVSVEVRIKNIWTDPVHIYCVGIRDSAERFIDWPDAWVAPGSTQSFYGSFTMPNQDVTLNVYSWYVGVDGYLYLDDTKSITVSLAALTPQFQGFGITDYSKV